MLNNIIVPCKEEHKLTNRQEKVFLSDFNINSFHNNSFIEIISNIHQKNKFVTLIFYEYINYL